MNVPHLKLGRRTSLVAAVTGVLVVGLAGWALAEGGVPLPGSSTSSSTDQTTTTTASGSPTGGASGDNVAVASNTVDGRTVVAISLKITQTTSDNVDQTNAAVAAASCSDCQTVAIALEGVLVAGSPTNFSPTNIAVAINSDCSNCQTLATAYQDVVQNDTRVRITGAGRRQIASIRQDLESLRTSGLDIVAIQQRVNYDAGLFLDVLRNEVVPIGRPATSPTTTPSSTTTTAPGSATTSTTRSTTSSTSTTTSTTTPATTTTTTVG